MRGLGTLAVALALVAPSATRPEPEGGVPDDAYGRIVLDRSSTHAGVPAVAFDHWRHRLRFTCRVCHADLAIALRAGETGISADTIQAGQHCGACHDGKPHAGVTVFSACTGWRRFDPGRPCPRCHTGAAGPPGGRADYEALARVLPHDASGFVDWDAAERRRLLAPSDFVEGISLHRPKMAIARDLPIGVKGTWLGSVTFSHRKHALWNGCELCHPEIFPVTARGAARYDMESIRAGQACGACHRTVAFPLSSCPRCHAIR